MQESNRVCFMVERKYIFLFLRAENDHSLVAFVAGKAAAACFPLADTMVCLYVKPSNLLLSTLNWFRFQPISCGLLC